MERPISDAPVAPIPMAPTCDRVLVGLGESGRAGPAGEQSGVTWLTRTSVVCAGEHGRDQQLEGVAVVDRCVHREVEAAEPGHDETRVGGGPGGVRGGAGVDLLDMPETSPFLGDGPGRRERDSV